MLELESVYHGEHGAALDDEIGNGAADEDLERHLLSTSTAKAASIPRWPHFAALSNAGEEASHHRYFSNAFDQRLTFADWIVLLTTMGIPQPAGPKRMLIGGRSVELPVFFPSVSSIKTNLRPVDYVEVLAAVGEPQFLVSAYDVANAVAAEKTKLVRRLSETAKRACVLLDSGNYESFWHGDHLWSAARYFRVLKSSPANLAFSFDNQKPAKDVRRGARAVSRQVDAAQAVATDRTSVLPIVHGTPQDLPLRVAAVARQSRPMMLAVPERCLGNGILARAATVRAIRRALDSVQPDCALHLLGTGNPAALAIYAIAGAQSFDGLEWCQTCADPATGRLLHFQHRELVREIAPRIVAGLPYAQATLVHNLFFFRDWMTRLRDSLERGRHAEFLRACTSPTTVRRLADSLKGEA